MISFLMMIGIFGQPQVAPELTSEQLVRAAIQAHGGKESLQKTLCSYHRRECLITVGGETTSVTGDIWIKAPKCVKSLVIISLGPNEVSKFMSIVNGEDVWATLGDKAVELSKSRIVELRQRLYELRLIALIPLLEDQSLKVALINEVKLDGKLLSGIKVSKQGFDDVELYFGKDSHMLTLLKAPRLNEDGKNVQCQSHFLSYKVFDGVKYPSKIIRVWGDNKIVEEVVRFTAHEIIDDKLFAKPYE